MLTLWEARAGVRFVGAVLPKRVKVTDPVSVRIINLLLYERLIISDVTVDISGLSPKNSILCCFSPQTDKFA